MLTIHWRGSSEIIGEYLILHWWFYSFYILNDCALIDFDILLSVIYRPWEQDRQMAIYHRNPDHIQVTSHPHLSMMPWDKSKRRGRVKVVQDWCFSHLPGSGCFISHHCANKRSKQIMRETYVVPYDFRLIGSVEKLRMNWFWWWVISMVVLRSKTR